MATLLYIHGFLSSPLSYKAQLTQQWLLQNRPDIHFSCPQLTPYPDECHAILNEVLEQRPEPVYLLGSSMGGFWAHYFAERDNLRAVLVNPAVEALTLMPAYVGQMLKSYYSETYYVLNNTHIEELKTYATKKITQPENFWLMAQTGDETLDYKAAVTQYEHCKQTIEVGGNHSFENFENHLPNIIDFFENT